MNRITHHLWFDHEAKEAAAFYTSLFPGAKTLYSTTLHNTPSDTPSGSVDVVNIELMGQQFTLISAGPTFKLNPSISFFVNFDPSKDKAAATTIDAFWKKLADGGTVRMPIGEYPFSKRYGWVEDKYGVNWQLILTDPKGLPAEAAAEAGDERPDLIPSLLFVGEQCGKAEEALKFYVSVFKDSPLDTKDATRLGDVMHYGPGREPEKADSVMFGETKLLDTWFAAMDSAFDHKFAFNEATSFAVQCDTQEQMDYYFEKLSAVPESEQCGWLKDKYGVSWQIVPKALDEMMASGDQAAIDRVTQAFLPMKKLDLKKLQAAYEEKESS